MIREALLKREPAVRDGFRLRGLGEVSRVEALSDGVIAFAITLLVVSLEVPRTFDELLVMMRGFLAFAAAFIFKQKPPTAEQPAERKRERASLVGIGLQGVGYAIAWAVHRPYFTPSASDGTAAVALAVVAAALAV